MTSRYGGTSQFALGNDMPVRGKIPTTPAPTFGAMPTPLSQTPKEEQGFTPMMDVPDEGKWGDGTASNSEVAIAGAGIELAGTLGTGLGELGSSKKDRRAESAARARFDAEEALNEAERKRQAVIADEYNKQVQELEDEKLSYFERMQEAANEFEEMLERAERESYAMLKFKSSGKMQRSFAESQKAKLNRGGEEQ